MRVLVSVEVLVSFASVRLRAWTIKIMMSDNRTTPIIAQSMIIMVLLCFLVDSKIGLLKATLGVGCGRGKGEEERSED